MAEDEQPELNRTEKTTLELIEEAKKRYSLARLAGLHVQDAGNEPDRSTFAAVSSAAQMLPELIERLKGATSDDPCLRIRAALADLDGFPEDIEIVEQLINRLFPEEEK